MGIASKLFGFPSLTLTSAAEVLLVLKLLPNQYSPSSHTGLALVVFLANYAFGVVFWFYLHPVFFSPLRHIPGPRVRRPLAGRHGDRSLTPT